MRVRDYIHVMDLAEGHRAALDCRLAEEMQLLNLGSAKDIPYWRWCRPWKPPADVPSPMRLPTVGLVMPPSAWSMPAKPLSAWAGAPSAGSKTSAATARHSSSRILEVLSEPIQLP